MAIISGTEKVEIFLPRINSLSTDFSFLGRRQQLSKTVRDICTDIGDDLFDLHKRLYYAEFLSHDAEISQLANGIRQVGEKADKINIGIDKVTENVKWISEKMDKAEQIISGVAENAQTVLDSLKEASEKAEEVLGWLKAK